MKSRKYASLLLLSILLVVGACSQAPSKSDIEETIVKYFTEKNYIVVELNISEITPIPLNERKYMGTPAYTVTLPTLILEMTEETGSPWNYKKGQKVSFSNAQISILQSTGHDKKWLISNISGVPIP